MDKKEGTGSIWNVNNWHWEAKNYTEIVNTLLEKKIKDHKFTKEDIEFCFTKIAKMKGDAQVNIRKAKQILCYEYDLEIEWRADSPDDECEGSFKVSDINESDLDFEVNNLSCKNEGELWKKARPILKKVLKDELIKLFKPINTEVMEMEADKQKLQEDQRRRAEAQQLTEKTKAETGELKEKLLQEQKEKDKQLKEKFSQVN